MTADIRSTPASRGRIIVGGLLLCASACAAPLLFGAATNRSVAALLVVVALSLFLAPAPRTRWNRCLFGLTAAGFLVYGLMAAAQLLLVGRFFPIDLLSEVEAVLDIPAAGGTLNTARASDALTRAALVAGALLCGILYGQSRRFAYVYLAAIAVSGLTIVIGALVLFHIEPGNVLWQPKRAYLRDFTTTFVSRGAAGAWLGLVAVTSLVLLVRRVSRLLANDIPDGGGALRRTVAATLESPLQILVLLAGLLVPAYGLLLSESRLALIVVCIHVVGLALFLLVFAGRHNPVVGIGIGVLIVGAGSALLWAGGAGIAQRLFESNLTADGRWAIWQSTLAGIAERPFLGYGVGTLRDGFALFRSEQLIGFGEIRSAHSLPLELAFESGAAIASLFSAAWAAACVALAAGVLRLDKFDGLSAAALAAATGAAFFTALDVASQSFGYVLPMLVMVGLGLAQMAHRVRRD